MTAGSSPKSWDMSQERAFIETLLNGRFNYILLLFSLITTGMFTVGQYWHLQFVLSIGTAVLFCLTLTVQRAQRKLDLIIDELKSDSAHPVSIIDERAGPSGTKRRLIGFYIPWALTIVVAVLAVLAVAGCLPAPMKAS